MEKDRKLFFDILFKYYDHLLHFLIGVLLSFPVAGLAVGALGLSDVWLLLILIIGGVLFSMAMSKMLIKKYAKPK